MIRTCAHSPTRARAHAQLLYAADLVLRITQWVSPAEVCACVRVRVRVRVRVCVLERVRARAPAKKAFCFLWRRRNGLVTQLSVGSLVCARSSPRLDCQRRGARRMIRETITL